jgi:3-oxoacyl-[acyl-carrier protein] reductase
MPKSLMVTGASRGIGLATIRRFFYADNDITDLIMVARESDDYADAARELESDNPHGKGLHTYQADVADKAGLHDLCQMIMATHGSVDVLVNNAGYTSPAPIHEIEFADFERTINVNLYAPFVIVQSLLHLGNQFDLVLNVASTAGITGRSGWLAYSSSKAAVIAMSQVMKEELAIYGTRVVCISPGRCATALRAKLAPDEDPTTIMQPEDVAGVIEMLASEAGRFVDSQNLVVRL